MIDPVRDLASVREATDRLLTAAAELDDASAAEPSRLPGWTRGHVLAHLARNADALVNVLDGPPHVRRAARPATPTSSGTRRARWPPSSPTCARAPPASRRRRARARRTGRARSSCATASPTPRPGCRSGGWIEVELHHVDLGIGYELEDLPGGVRRAGDRLPRRSGSPGTPTCPPRSNSRDGRRPRGWHTGAPRGPAPAAGHRAGARPPCSAGSPAAATAAGLGRTDGGACCPTLAPAIG